MVDSTSVSYTRETKCPHCGQSIPTVGPRRCPACNGMIVDTLLEIKVADLEPVKKRLELGQRALALLKSVEYADMGICPSCGFAKDHHPECELAVLLQEAGIPLGEEGE